MMNSCSTTQIDTLHSCSCVNPMRIFETRLNTIPDNDMYRFTHDVYTITQELLQSKLCTWANDEYNHDTLCLIQDIVDSLPKLAEVSSNKLIIPVFDEIEVLPEDTQEIKKFIRKANYEFLGFYCNHKTSDEKCNKFASKTLNIVDMKEFQHYKQFLDNLSSNVTTIRKLDYEREHDKHKYEHRYNLPIKSEIESVVKDIIAINAKILEFNASMNPRCSRCEAYIRKYNYVLKEVKRMRDEEQIIQQRREAIQNNDVVQKPQTISEFIREHFAESPRFKVSVVKELYKNLYNITKTFKEIQNEVDAMQGYKVSNCQNVLWITKL